MLRGMLLLGEGRVGMKDVHHCGLILEEPGFSLLLKKGEGFTNLICISTLFIGVVTDMVLFENIHKCIRSIIDR